MCNLKVEEWDSRLEERFFPEVDFTHLLGNASCNKWMPQCNRAVREEKESKRLLKLCQSNNCDGALKTKISPSGDFRGCVYCIRNYNNNKKATSKVWIMSHMGNFANIDLIANWIMFILNFFLQMVLLYSMKCTNGFYIFRFDQANATMLIYRVIFANVQTYYEVYDVNVYLIQGESVWCINEYQCLVFPSVCSFWQSKCKAKLHTKQLTYIQYIAVQNHVTINKLRNKSSDQNNKAFLKSSFPWYSFMKNIARIANAVQCHS